MEPRQGSFYYIITAKVMHDKNLNHAEKLMFGILSGLADENGKCFPSNEWLSEVLGIKDRSIQEVIKKLEDSGYISRQIISCANNPFKKYRIIFVHRELKKCLPDAENRTLDDVENRGPDMRKTAHIISEDKNIISEEGESPVVPKGTPLSSNRIQPRKKSREEKKGVADRVFVSQSQHDSLLKKADGNEDLVCQWYEKLSEWKISKELTGGTNDYKALIGWVPDAVKEDLAKKSRSPENRALSNREFCEKIKKMCPGIEKRTGVAFGPSYVEYAPSAYNVTVINFTDNGFEEQVRGLARKLGYVLKDL